ncbi:hypothetical protein T05_8234 [Trichinella murrelli]|uniref:Uncharacterized protein n=1 Tax=Trichinella murrelli TaxID=144512 RepID=A0A0V0U299_9BILA|nr:hypothetical protein T05_8234 [Trichinella murrelli]
MESQLSGRKFSVMPHSCHNSRGQSTYKRDLQVQRKDFLTFGPLSRSTDEHRSRGQLTVIICVCGIA